MTRSDYPETNGRRKVDIAEQLIAALVPYLDKNGILDLSPDKVFAGALRANIAGVEVQYLPNAARLSNTSAPRLIDIWLEGGNKVFSAWFNPIDVVSFRRGEWVDDLLAYLQAKAQNPGVERRGSFFIRHSNRWLS